jgi:hypothetical protein
MHEREQERIRLQLDRLGRLIKIVRGNLVVKRKTPPNWFRRGLKGLSECCRWDRRQAMAEQHRTVSQKLMRHDAHYGITGNSAALGSFRRICKRWLSRPHRGGWKPWARLIGMLERQPLPAAVHSVCRSVALTWHDKPGA